MQVRLRLESIVDQPTPPISLTAAKKQNRPDFPEWKAAAETEMAAKAANGTIREIIKIPPNELVIASRIVFSYKLNETESGKQDGTIYDHRGRWVAQDFLPKSQRAEVDATYVATGKHAGIRSFMARSIQIANIFFRKVDAIKAYTQTVLKTRVLVKLPDGFKQYDSDGNEYCVVLAKALEGLRESGNLWQADTVRWLTNEKDSGCFGQGAFKQLR